MCPIFNRENVTLSLLVRGGGALGFSFGLILNNLFSVSFSHSAFQSFWVSSLTLGRKSEWGSLGVLLTSIGRLNASFANESAISFPSMPI